MTPTERTTQPRGHQQGKGSTMRYGVYNTMTGRLVSQHRLESRAIQAQAREEVRPSRYDTRCVVVDHEVAGQ